MLSHVRRDYLIISDIKATATNNANFKLIATAALDAKVELDEL